MMMPMPVDENEGGEQSDSKQPLAEYDDDNGSITQVVWYGCTIDPEAKNLADALAAKTCQQEKLL